MKLAAFFKSPLGNLVLFLTLLGVGGLMLYRNNAHEKMEAKELTPVEKTEPAALHASITRVTALFKPTAVSALPSGDQLREKDRVRSDALDPLTRARGARSSGPKMRLAPLSLVVLAKAAAEEPELSGVYAPYGRLIPCETVITLESSKLDTPIIGLVTDDVWHNGKLIIPAGAEVHGRASVDRSRERIAASGQWVIVRRDATDRNGAELVLTGIALERDKNDVTKEFGLRDGSAGLIGDVLRTDDLQEVKLFASTFIAGLASGLQKTQIQTSALGATEIATGTARDAALHGTADVLNAYARQIQEAVSRDGFFVRVPAGKQFYIYVTETIDQSRATLGNHHVVEIWKKTHDN